MLGNSIGINWQFQNDWVHRVRETERERERESSVDFVLTSVLNCCCKKKFKNIFPIFVTFPTKPIRSLFPYTIFLVWGQEAMPSGYFCTVPQNNRGTLARAQPSAKNSRWLTCGHHPTNLTLGPGWPASPRTLCQSQAQPSPGPRASVSRAGLWLSYWYPQGMITTELTCLRSPTCLGLPLSLLSLYCAIPDAISPTGFRKFNLHFCWL